MFEQEDQIRNLKIGLPEETLKSYLIEKELSMYTEGRTLQNSCVETESSISWYFGGGILEGIRSHG